MADTSRPDDHDRPSPRQITARTSGRPRSSSRIENSRRSMASSNALCLSTLALVIVATGPSMSSRTRSSWCPSNTSPSLGRSHTLTSENIVLAVAAGRRGDGRETHRRDPGPVRAHRDERDGAPGPVDGPDRPYPAERPVAGPAQILRLQRHAGNRAVASLLRPRPLAVQREVGWPEATGWNKGDIRTLDPPDSPTKPHKML